MVEFSINAAKAIVMLYLAGLFTGAGFDAGKRVSAGIAYRRRTTVNVGGVMDQIMLRVVGLRLLGLRARVAALVFRLGAAIVGTAIVIDVADRGEA